MIGELNVAKRLTDKEVEDMMTRRIAKAIYPILYPVEEQCMQIQAEHAQIIDTLSCNLWKAFCASYTKEN